MPGNLSLYGIREYATNRDGVPTYSPSYSCLRDLEDLINKMNDIRSGNSTEGCSSHGDEVPSEYGESMTVCSSHSFSYSERSLGQLGDAIDMLQYCDCDAYQNMYCDCQENQEWCNCNSEY